MKRVSLTAWILIAVAAGTAFGLLAPASAVRLEILGAIFLRLINAIIAPLMFSTLVVSVARSGSLRSLGRIGAKAMILFTAVSGLALLIGLGTALAMKPGVGVDLASAGSGGVIEGNADWRAVLLSPFPTSIFDAMARGDVLQIVVFAILFGAACTAIGAKAQPVIQFLEALETVMFRFTDFVMYFAPVGIFGAMAAAIGSKGAGLLLNLGALILAVYVGLIVFLVVVQLPIAIVAGVPLAAFARAIREPFLIAFSTTSSNVALPVALENMVGMGVPQQIAALVLPLSMSFNTAGSALFLSLATIFVAQAAGSDLSSGTMLLIVLTLLLTTKGIGAVPRGSLMILAGTLTTFGLPPAGVAIILGVDQLMDMARTSVNMISHGLAAAVVARWEGAELNRTVEQ